MPSFIDGGWFDIASIAVAVVYAIYRKIRFDEHRWVCIDMGKEIANGVGLFPLFILAIASFSSAALASLLQSNKLILSIAGIVALFAILDDGDQPSA